MAPDKPPETLKASKHQKLPETVKQRRVLILAGLSDLSWNERWHWFRGPPCGRSCRGETTEPYAIKTRNPKPTPPTVRNEPCARPSPAFVSTMSEAMIQSLI